MLVIIPQFYRKFKCIASRCTDSCCKDWAVEIDDITLAKYKKIKGELGARLLNSIQDKTFCLTTEKKCPFLNGENLCEIILQCGENYLSDICREHPRFVEVYGDIKELGLGLACEEVVRIFLNEKLSFESFFDSDKEDEIPDEVRNARDLIFMEREEMLALLEDKSLSFRARLKNLLNLAKEFNPTNFQEQNEFSKDEILKAWKNILFEGESVDLQWEDFLQNLEANTHYLSEDESAKIIAYEIFRYYAKSLFDGEGLSKIKFAIFFWWVIETFGASFSENKINTIKLISKQLEYSESIFQNLEKNFKENPLFSVKSFLKIIEG